MSNLQQNAQATQSDLEKAAAMDKEAESRLNAFAMGIGRLCDETGIPYENLAKAAGLEPAALAPSLAETFVDAAQQQAAQAQA